MNSSKVEPSQNRFAIILAYFCIYFVWGSTYYFIGVALKELPLFLLGALRFSIAGVMLLLWCFLRGERIFRKSLVAKSAVSGTILLFIDMVVIMAAQKYVNSSFVAMTAASTALWIMLFDVPRWKDNFRKVSVVAGMLIGFVGVLLLFVEPAILNGSRDDKFGIAILIFGCISWSLGTLYTKYSSIEAEKPNDLSGPGWQMLIAGLLFWVCSTLDGDLSQIRGRQLSTSTALSLAYLTIFGSIFAYASYVWLLKVRPSIEVATHAYVNPLVAVALGGLIGAETVTALQIVGLLVIFFGVVLVQGRAKPVQRVRNVK